MSAVPEKIDTDTLALLHKLRTQRHGGAVARCGKFTMMHQRQLAISFPSLARSAVGAISNIDFNYLSAPSTVSLVLFQLQWYAIVLVNSYDGNISSAAASVANYWAKSSF